MRTTIVQELLHDVVSPARLIPALTSGLVLGLLMIVIELSFATLIFSGSLAEFAPAASGLTLFGGFVMCLALALGSSFPATICLPQDTSAAVLAAVAAGIAVSLSGIAAPAEAFATVGAAMVLSTLATGVLFLAMARFGLGSLMRYMPYPVVVGFLAGIGWLLVQGSFSIVLGISLNWSTLPQLLTAEKALRFAPAAGLMLVLFIALKRWKSVFILPATLLLAIGGFALYLVLTGQSLMDAGGAGHLLGGMPEKSLLWPVFGLADIALVRCDALVPQLPQLCTIPLVSAISFLLISSGLEAATNRDLDLKRELNFNALANILAGAGGSHAGYTTLSLSLLGPKTGSDSRLVGVSAALLVGVAIFFGAEALGSFPRFILGGMILYLGVATLFDCLVSTRREVTLPEYGLILAILLAIALFGFLSGVAFGLFMATVLFVIKYSRLQVVRQDTDATALSSTKKRSVPDEHILREHGRGIRILRVSGYLFFGSASVLSRAVDAHLKAKGQVPTHLIIDFAEADGFDSSAVNIFLRILQKSAAEGCVVVLAAAPPKLEEQMRRAAPNTADAAKFLPDLDRGLEWCEDAVLAKVSADSEAQQDRIFDLAVDDMLVRLAEAERFEALVERLGGNLESRKAMVGEVILRQGEAPGGVWLFVSGQAEETALTEGGASIRLRTLGPGSMAGQAAQDKGHPAPGSITALTDCTLHFLPTEALRRIEALDPATALAFHSHYAAVLESRLAEVVRK